jgi:hypothetical protein
MKKQMNLLSVKIILIYTCTEFYLVQLNLLPLCVSFCMRSIGEPLY